MAAIVVFAFRATTRMGMMMTMTTTTHNKLNLTPTFAGYNLQRHSLSWASRALFRAWNLRAKSGGCDLEKLKVRAETEIHKSNLLLLVRRLLSALIMCFTASVGGAQETKLSFIWRFFLSSFLADYQIKRVSHLKTKSFISFFSR